MSRWESDDDRDDRDDVVVLVVVAVVVVVVMPLVDVGRVMGNRPWLLLLILAVLPVRSMTLFDMDDVVVVIVVIFRFVWIFLLWVDSDAAAAAADAVVYDMVCDVSACAGDFMSGIMDGDVNRVLFMAAWRFKLFNCCSSEMLFDVIVVLVVAGVTTLVLGVGVVLLWFCWLVIGAWMSLLFCCIALLTNCGAVSDVFVRFFCGCLVFEREGRIELNDWRVYSFSRFLKALEISSYRAW